MQDVLVLHAKVLQVDRISCRQLLSRGPELADHLGYSREGIRRGTHAACGMSVEAKAHGGGVPSMCSGGVTASLQSIGATGQIKPEAKRAIAGALRRTGYITERDYLAALQERRQMVVVEIPRYFSTDRSQELPLLVSDYREGGYNQRKAEQMLDETRVMHGARMCLCCGDRCEMEVEQLQRIENAAAFERFKVYEASVADDLQPWTNNADDEKLVRGIHEWLQRLAIRNGLSQAANTVYLMHGTKKNNISAICQRGLETKYSMRRNPDGLYGRGLYFTNSSCKAFQYAGHGGCIIICRVVLGRIQLLKQEDEGRFFAAPTYHSAMAMAKFTQRRNAPQVHDEYIVFNDDAVYPEFVLTLK